MRKVLTLYLSDGLFLAFSRCFAKYICSSVQDKNWWKGVSVSGAMIQKPLDTVTG